MTIMIHLKHYNHQDNNHLDNIRVLNLKILIYFNFKI